jgi:hypothetical protein
LFSSIDTWLFEVLTTVPFGVLSYTADPNRILSCYLDPDHGIDRALTILGLDYEVRSWPADTLGTLALEQLREWLLWSPVVLGPVDMGLLPYFFHSEIYAGMDHYVVATEFDSQTISMCDPEGVPMVQISHDDLLSAWRGKRVPEGRGEFVMRRVVSRHAPLWNNQLHDRVLRLAAKNLLAAQMLERGGGKCITAISTAPQAFIQNPSSKRALTYILSTQAQRAHLISRYLQLLEDLAKPRVPQSFLDDSVKVLVEQSRLYGEAVGDLLLNRPSALESLGRIGLLEDRLTYLFNDVLQASLRVHL